MSTRIGFWKTVFSATGEHWRETLILTGYTVLGGLAPLWIGLLLLRWYSQDVTLPTVASHGEFALYSASIVAPLLYQLGRDRSGGSLPGKGTLLLLGVAFLVFSIASYAPISTAVLGTARADSFDVDYYSWSTALLFLFCLILLIAVTLVENAMTLPAVHEMVEDDYKEFSAEFDKLGGSDGSH